NINAYHQPGVEAGKKAAGVFLDLLQSVKNALTDESQTAEELANSIDADPEDVYHCLNHLASNGQATLSPADSPAGDTFSK
ncbi:MAG: glucose-6-phosphate isomerase, partial [Akkermansiaceae bacterium]